MFHTFQSSAALRSPGADPDSAERPPRSSGSRRISTSNACVECRRRKIRCDGSQPCGQCQWYQHPEACSYSKPAQRIVPSRKLVDKLSGNIEQYKSVLSKLYGCEDLESLARLPREELLELALSSPSTNVTASPSTGGSQAWSDNPTGRSSSDNLEALAPAPLADNYEKKARQGSPHARSTSDDTKNHSVSVEKLFSYVGVSSVTAAIKVIVRCAPQAHSFIAPNGQDTVLPSRGGSPLPELADDGPYALPQPDHGQEILESYFDRIHPFLPMIDEPKFWSTYLYSDRKDSAWLGLLNMVFAVGCLASSSADSHTHYTYFNRSRQHLSLESFGSGSLEVLQTLAIMSGYYMHYLDRPNEAHSLMGGTLRMATALGLHREYSDKSDLRGNLGSPSADDLIAPEMRRRVWWSLFCLDAWASTTTGRPSLGSMGPSITVLRPGVASEVPAIPPPNSPRYIDQLKILPLIHASSFCQIAATIQDRLIEMPLLSSAEMASFDAQIMNWYDELPSVLSDPEEACPEFLLRVRLVMKWRFQNIRIVLHRPMLLTTALRRSTWSMLSAEEKIAVGTCREIACDTIEDISQECMPDLISGWNAVWFCFQACMVPLVSLFSDTSVPDEIEKWEASIETALQFFESIMDWSSAAKRCGDAVNRLYEAYKSLHSATPGTQTTVPTMSSHYQSPTQIAAHNITNAANMFHPTQTYEHLQSSIHYDPTTPIWADVNDPTILDSFWDGMMWDTNVPDTLESAFGLGNEYEYTGAAHHPSLGGDCWMHVD